MESLIKEHGKALFAGLVACFVILLIVANVGMEGKVGNIFSAANKYTTTSIDNDKSFNYDMAQSANGLKSAYSRKAPEVKITKQLKADKTYAVNGEIVKSNNSSEIKSVKVIHVYYLGKNGETKREVLDTINGNSITFPRMGNYEIKVTATGKNGVKVSENGLIGVGADVEKGDSL